MNTELFNYMDSFIKCTKKERIVFHKSMTPYNNLDDTSEHQICNDFGDLITSMHIIQSKYKLDVFNNIHQTMVSFTRTKDTPNNWAIKSHHIHSIRRIIDEVKSKSNNNVVYLYRIHDMGSPDNSLDAQFIIMSDGDVSEYEELCNNCSEIAFRIGADVVSCTDSITGNNYLRITIKDES